MGMKDGAAMNRGRREQYPNGAEGSRRNADGALFSEHRARLFKIAHRMLGSRADAEDVLQDVYLRWRQYATADVRSPLAFLITIATRLCLDRLRALRQQTCQWIDGWQPSSSDEDHAPSPEAQLELRDRVTMAFVSVLECLGPDERAVFLLHDVFDYDYGEVAQYLGKSEPSCRQIVHRARERLREPHPRFVIASGSRERALEKFVSAIEAGDRASVMALLAVRIDCETAGDGGSRRGAIRKIQCPTPAVSRFVSMTLPNPSY
jgi:RNA polymerase sigma-70 factor (ECF subfamily)